MSVFTRTQRATIANGGQLISFIERDVRLLAEVSDLQQFGRFVRLAAAMTAQEIN